MLFYLCFAFLITFCTISLSKGYLFEQFQPILDKSDCSWYKLWIPAQFSVDNVIRSLVTHMQKDVHALSAHTFYNPKSQLHTTVLAQFVQQQQQQQKQQQQQQN